MIVLVRNGRDARSQRGARTAPRCSTFPARRAVIAILLSLGITGLARFAAAEVLVARLNAKCSADTTTVSCELRYRQGAGADSIVAVRYRLLVSIEGGEALRDPGWKVVEVRRNPGRETVTAQFTGTALPVEARLQLALLIDEGNGVRTAARRTQSTRGLDAIAPAFGKFPEIPDSPQPAMSAGSRTRLSMGQLKVRYAGSATGEPVW
jgi:hypothetical protein